MKCLWCGEEVERAQPILSFLLGANRKCICVTCEHPFIELKQHPTCREVNDKSGSLPGLSKMASSKRSSAFKEYSLICL